MGTISRDAYGIFDKSGSKERRIIPYTGPTSYATGGDTFNPETISLKLIEALVGLTIMNAAKTVLWGHWDRANKKILWFSATATEVNNLTDLSGYTGNFEAIGK